MIFHNKRLYSELPSGPREKAALALAAPRESEMDAVTKAGSKMQKEKLQNAGNQNGSL